MPITSDATISQPTFEIPEYDQANVMTWFDKNVMLGYRVKTDAVSARESYASYKAYIWDHSEAFVDWQLASPNTSTRENDTALGALTKYTDGYAMKIKGKLAIAGCTVGKGCGFCLNASENGSSCVLWTNPSNAGLNLSSQANLWVSNTKWTATGARLQSSGGSTTLDTLYTDAISTTKTNVISSDNVMGFNGNWYCPTPKGVGLFFEFECSRFLPKSTKTNAYTGDFRFAPKMEVGATNPEPPTYTMYTFTEIFGASYSFMRAGE